MVDNPSPTVTKGTCSISPMTFFHMFDRTTHQQFRFGCFGPFHTLIISKAPWAVASCENGCAHLAGALVYLQQTIPTIPSKLHGGNCSMHCILSRESNTHTSIQNQHEGSQQISDFLPKEVLFYIYIPFCLSHLIHDLHISIVCFFI